MKKLLIVSLIAISGLAISFNADSSKISSKQELSSVACQYGQCSATAKSTGVRCKNCCQQGSSTCWSHR